MDQWMKKIQVQNDETEASCSKPSISLSNPGDSKKKTLLQDEPEDARDSREVLEHSYTRKRKLDSSKTTKMYTFSNNWINDPDLKDWISKSTKENTSCNTKNEMAFCKVCQCELLAHKTLLRKHGASEKHKFNSQQIAQNKKITDVYKTTSLNENIRNAELKLCGLLAQINLSFSVIDTLSPLLSNIFPDSQIAKGLSLKRTKATAIVIESLGKTFLDELYKKLGYPGCFFSLVMDETTDISVKKQCAFTVIYYDNHQNRVVTEFFDLVEGEGGTARELFNCLKNCVENKKIPLENLVGFSSDTTNVMAGNFNSVFSLLKEEIPQITCIKCSCHMAHLATSKACLKLPRSVEDLLRNIGSHFNRSSLRRKKFLEFQVYFQVDIHKILSPAVTRWLSIKTCVDRVLEQYEPLKAYLREQVFEDPSITTDQMLATMENRFTMVYLEFMSYSLELMTDFNLLFQSNRPLLHRVKPETEKLLKTLCTNFMNIATIRGENILRLNHENPNNFMPLDEIYIGISATESINSLKTNPEVDINEYNNFMKSILSFYIELVSGIKQRFSFDDPIFDHLSIVDPSVAQAYRIKSLKHIVDRFPVLNKSITSVQVLDNEWRQHALLDFGTLNLPVNLPETYWYEIFSMKNSTGTTLFPNLKIVISLLLILPFSNASVERVFSDLFNIKTDKRSLLNTSTIRALLATKTGIKNQGDCINFIPNKKMLNAKIWQKKE